VTSRKLALDAWLEATEAGRADAFDLLGRRLDDARFDSMRAPRRWMMHCSATTLKRQ